MRRAVARRSPELLDRHDGRHLAARIEDCATLRKERYGMNLKAQS
jgi:hypothetical protein